MERSHYVDNNYNYSDAYASGSYLEKTALLGLSTEIAQVRDRENLLLALHENLKVLIPFNDVVITLYDLPNKTHYAFLYYSEAKRREHPDFMEARDTHSPIEDGVVNKTLNNDGPVIFQVDELLTNPLVPQYVSFYKKSGIVEFIGVSMHNRNGIFGGLYLFSEQQGTYHQDQFVLIQGVANQLSAAVTNILIGDEILQKEKERVILLNIGKDLSAITNKKRALDILLERLNTLFHFDHAVLTIAGNKGEIITSYGTDTICKDIVAHQEFIANDYPLPDLQLWQSKDNNLPHPVQLDDFDKNPVSGYIRNNSAFGMRQAIFARLQAGREIIGELTLMSTTINSFTKPNLELLQGLFCQLSYALNSIGANNEIAKRNDEKALLVSLSNDLAAVRNRSELQQVICDRFQSLFSFSHVMMLKVSSDEKWLDGFLLDNEIGYNKNGVPNIKSSVKYPLKGYLDSVLKNDKPIILNLDDVVVESNTPGFLKINQNLGMREVMLVGLKSGKRKTGLLAIFSDKLGQIMLNHVSLICSLSSQLSTAMANIIAYEKIEKQVLEISSFKRRLEEENLYLQEEIQISQNYSEIIGASTALKKVFNLVANVAATSSSVLILGETGTGKELVARAIHNSSLRKGKVMIKVNCATLPANLIESELFGHERGSFTGATDRRIGKFELANNSTLFLDEIGEMPLDLQVKLLRALQEKEIERIGGKTIIKTDVRIIAATNRDLEKEVQLGNFRSDLYYRLNVFPILIPPLRERKEDIPMLASHFLTKLSKKTGKQVNGFSKQVIKDLISYNWPGNIRELEHLVERSILLANYGLISELDLPLTESVDSHDISWFDGNIKTIEELEKDHIISVLKFCNGKVGGAGGAAEILKLPSTTLESKIKKFGIKKEA
jgi:formate hydrogenlyase transcriptional activator